MGRGVMTVSDAVCVVYLHHSDEEWDGIGKDTDWEFFVEGLRDTIRSRYPSFRAVDSWDGREEKRILENELARVVVCEYAGIVSISLAIRNRDVEFEHEENLAEHWCKQITNGFQQLFLDRLRKLGTMSNGVSVYDTELRG